MMGLFKRIALLLGACLLLTVAGALLIAYFAPDVLAVFPIGILAGASACVVLILYLFQRNFLSLKGAGDQDKKNKR